MTEINHQIARLDGIFRCMTCGQTLYRRAGDHLTSVKKCKNDSHKWEYCLEDNTRKEDLIPLFVGSGLIHAIPTSELPEIGMRLNIRQAMDPDCGLLSGEYIIKNVDDKFAWKNGKKEIRIHVERVGGFCDTLPIRQARLMTC